MKELAQLEGVLKKFAFSGSVEQLATVSCKSGEYPIYGLILGPKDRSKPTLGIFGGIHGIERVGTHLAIKFLDVLYKQLQWDKILQDILASCRIVSIPLINPGGMAVDSRSNPNGVDLMRNAPVEAESSTGLLSGHRIGPWLPWYRGVKGGGMEVESQALVHFVEREMYPARFSMAMDLHSGFGHVDRLWYPYGRTQAKFPRKHIVDKVKHLMDDNLPYHVYHVEAQSDSYMIHGDVWDYLFDKHFEKFGQHGNIFVPWTLEMGSWNWLKKNPLQIFSFKGLFNPIVPHRYKRTLRRHRSLLEFMLRIVYNFQGWMKKN